MLHASGTYNSLCLQKQLAHSFAQKRTVTALLLLPVTGAHQH